MEINIEKRGEERREKKRGGGERVNEWDREIDTGRKGRGRSRSGVKVTGKKS